MILILKFGIRSERYKMFECEFCHQQIDGTTDDNYNKDHTGICCPYCNEWNKLVVIGNHDEMFWQIND